MLWYWCLTKALHEIYWFIIVKSSKSKPKNSLQWIAYRAMQIATFKTLPAFFFWDLCWKIKGRGISFLRTFITTITGSQHATTLQGKQIRKEIYLTSYWKKIKNKQSFIKAITINDHYEAYSVRLELGSAMIPHQFGWNFACNLTLGT